jgi:RecQ family ATP-dependent DNA helicase
MNEVDKSLQEVWTLLVDIKAKHDENSLDGIGLLTSITLSPGSSPLRKCFGQDNSKGNSIQSASKTLWETEDFNRQPERETELTTACSQACNVNITATTAIKDQANNPLINLVINYSQFSPHRPQIERNEATQMSSKELKPNQLTSQCCQIELAKIANHSQQMRCGGKDDVIVLNIEVDESQVCNEDVASHSNKNLEVTIEENSAYEGLECLPHITHDTMIKWSGYLNTYFSISSLRKFQEHAVNALTSGKDVVVIQSTSSGKSLVYQLPAIMSTDQITLCLCPTISLMQDQVANLTAKGIDVIRLGSDHTLADYNAVFKCKPEHLPKIVFMTPEYLFGINETSGCLDNVKKMEEEGRLAYIVIDEAHYIWQWGGSFRKTYSHLKSMKELFPNTPIAALTATATPDMLEEIKVDLLRSPFVVRGSVNRPNVYIAIERGQGFGETLNKGKKKEKAVVSDNDRFAPTAKRIKENISTNSAIVYASFAEDCRKLAKTLQEIGVKVEYYVGCSGSMTAKEKEAVYRAFKDKTIQVICGTEAFGVGIDIPHVRYAIRVGCPPCLQLWVQ